MVHGREFGGYCTCHRNSLHHRIKKQILTLTLVLSLAACDKVDKPATSSAEIALISDKVEPSSIADMLAKDPQFSWLTVMRDIYPSEFAKIDEKLRSIDRSDDLNARKLAMASLVKPLMDAHRTVAQTAPDADIVAYLRKNTVVAETLLKSDPNACTDVFRGSLDPETTFPDATWKIISDATAQLMLTSRAAEKYPTIRNDTLLTKEDIKAWRQGMQSVGAGPGTFTLLSDPALKMAASPLEKCRVRVQMMRGALALPEPLAAKIMLNILN